MKKKLLAALICVVCATGAFAQSVSVGPKLGLNLSKVNDGTVPEKNTSEPFKPGLNFGLVFNMPISSFLSFQPEVLYSEKGSRLNREIVLSGWNQNYTRNDSYTSSLRYFEVPLMLKANLTPSAPVNVYVNGGISLGYWMSTKSFRKTEINDNGKLSTSKSSETEHFENMRGEQRMEAGLNLGAGAEMPLGANRLAFEFRYNQGLTSIVDPSQNRRDGRDYPVRNQVLSLSLIYFVNL
jgi:opacity protein-like surface antigen